MIIVTGGAGFIGSNLVKGLNGLGRADITVVDDLTEGRKFANLVDCDIRDYVDKHEFLEHVQWGMEPPERVDAMFHLGACTAVTDWNGRHMMSANYAYAKALLDYCMDRGIPFLYASSAQVYGCAVRCAEEPACERPCNVFGYSKLLFDQYVRRAIERSRSQIVGLRCFSVYGPNEGHKGAAASIVRQFNDQVLDSGAIRAYADGEQRRDLVHVDDVVGVFLWFAQQPERAGIYNVGSGSSHSYNDIARMVLDWHGRGRLEHVPLPAQFAGCHPERSEADLSRLRGAGYAAAFRGAADGVPAYLEWLNAAAVPGR